MTLQLDHIVIAVNDLETAIADYTTLGFNVLRGGDHPGRTTHNALVVFADGSYFELIAWKAPAPEERWWQLLQRHGEGVVDFALLPQSTSETVKAAAQRGLVLDGPLDGGRLRPDGERLHWQTARPPSPDLPFLCGDLTPRALRVPEGNARRHPNGVTGVASLAIAVRDLDATVARYRALLGPDAVDTHVGRAVNLPGAQSRLALVTLGENTIVLSSPRDARGDADTAQDPLELRLAARGEGPFAIVLRTSANTAATTGALDLGLTHGASIELDATTAPAVAKAPLADTATA
ncbi:VOC family protein [Variovorax sp. Sphag1AA]|uniref:VOC family protein n=1 Tax=Variovorax sp. Sphag1AA TaxID=2587027 RepID=UPI0016127A84|nr:VOC family protein [Variovorax sp. Sphag1AA]MBB3180854.1 catechol 2,3-dioxygenase-like lactoylglutathione lyase family enzyme [Variovorax sp. Sphag1AA]